MSNSTIDLNLINQSQDTNNSTVVIFQKNEAMADAPVIAWRVLHGTAGSEPYAFTYSSELYVSACDANGNDTGMVPAQAELSVTDRGFGIEIAQAEDAERYLGNEIVLSNEMPQGAITARVYRDGQLLAQATVGPQEKSRFQFKPTIWVGALSEIEEGSVMNAAILQDINTQLLLSGIMRANLLMSNQGTGGPSVFSLIDVVRAVSSMD